MEGVVGGEGMGGVEDLGGAVDLVVKGGVAEAEGGAEGGGSNASKKSIRLPQFSSCISIRTAFIRMNRLALTTRLTILPRL